MKKNYRFIPSLDFSPFFVKLPYRLQWPLILHGYGCLWQPQKYYGLNFNWGSMLPDPFRMLCTIHKQKHSVSSFQLSVCILCVFGLRAALSTHLHMFFFPKRTYLGLHTDQTYQNRMVDPMQNYQVSLIGCKSCASLAHTLACIQQNPLYLFHV